MTVWGENKLPLGRNTIGFVLGEHLDHLMKKKMMEEKKGASMPNLFSLSFSFFLSFDGCISFPTYVLVSFLRV